MSNENCKDLCNRIYELEVVINEDSNITEENSEKNVYSSGVVENVREHGDNNRDVGMNLGSGRGENDCVSDENVENAGEENKYSRYDCQNNVNSECDDNELSKTGNGEANDVIRDVPFGGTQSLVNRNYFKKIHKKEIVSLVIGQGRCNLTQLPENLNAIYEQNIMHRIINRGFTLSIRIHANRASENYMSGKIHNTLTNTSHFHRFNNFGSITNTIFSNANPFSSLETNENIIVPYSSISSDQSNIFLNIIISFEDFCSILNTFTQNAHLLRFSESNENSILRYTISNDQSNVFLNISISCFEDFCSILNIFTRNVHLLRFSESNESCIVPYCMRNNLTKDFLLIRSLNNLGSTFTFPRNNTLNSLNFSELNENIMPYGIRNNLSNDFPGYYILDRLSHFTAYLNYYLQNANNFNSSEVTYNAVVLYNISNNLSNDLIRLWIQFCLNNFHYTLNTVSLNATNPLYSFHLFTMRNIGNPSRSFIIIHDVRLDTFNLSSESIPSLREGMFIKNGYWGIFPSIRLMLQRTQAALTLSQFDIDFRNIDHRSLIFEFLAYIANNFNVL